MSARIRPVRRALLASGAALALTAGLVTAVAVAADAAPGRAVASRSSDDGAAHQRHTGTDDRSADDGARHQRGTGTDDRRADDHGTSRTKPGRTKAEDRARYGKDDRRADDHGRHGQGKDDRPGDDRA